MPPEPNIFLERANTASSDELKLLVHASDEEVLLAVLENPRLEAAHVTLLLERLDLSANVLSAVSAQGKWMSSESVRLRLACHPRTPKRIALATAKQLYLFDLVRLSVLPSAPADIKRAGEEIIVARLPQLPVGQKLTLARRGPARVAGAILAEGHPQAVKVALNNAHLTESQLLRVLANSNVPERVVAAIAQHPRWSCRYNVRMALVRNPHTPFPSAIAFLAQLTWQDLRMIAGTQDLSPHLRKYIERELARELRQEQQDSG